MLNTGYSLVLAHHANEKYCFDCMHKYKIGDKKNDIIFLITYFIFMHTIKTVFFISVMS